MEPWITVVIAICSVLVAVAVFIAIYFSFIRKARVKVRINKVGERYEHLLDFMQNDCENRMARIKEMADAGAPGYEDRYMDILADFKTIASKNKYEADLAVNSISSNGKYSKISPKDVGHAEKCLYIFERELESLKQKIDSARSDDDSYHAMILDSKSRLRDLKSIYSEHDVELRPIESRLDNLYQSFESSFEQYESALDIADYEYARRILSKINRTLDEFERNGREIHIQLPLVTDVLPKRLDRVEAYAKDTEEKGIDIHKLEVEKRCEAIRKATKAIEEEILELKLGDVSRQIQELKDDMDSLEGDIDNEIRCRDSFLAGIEDIEDSIESTKEKFDNVSSLFKNSRGKFVMDEGDDDAHKVIGEKLYLALRIDREMEEASKDENTPTPYSVLSKTLRMLKDLVAEINEEIDSLLASIESMDGMATRIKKDLSDSYFELCNTRRMITELDVRNYSKAMNPRLVSLMKEIDEIYELASKTPIDVSSLKKLYDGFVAKRDAYGQEVRRDCVMAEKSEILMTYANQKRLNSRMIADALDDSMNLFFDGDFEKSYEVLDREFKTTGKMGEN